MCKVHGCQQAHSKHYCKSCGDKNSDHFSSKCNYIIAYHGTDLQTARLIQNGGFKPSSKGRMGSGVYLAVKFKIAKKVAELRV